MWTVTELCHRVPGRDGEAVGVPVQGEEQLVTQETASQKHDCLHGKVRGMLALAEGR